MFSGYWVCAFFLCVSSTENITSIKRPLTDDNLDTKVYSNSSDRLLLEPFKKVRAFKVSLSGTTSMISDTETISNID